jgi:hypothetical protein
MISLASDYLLFKMASGESLPFSASMISVELMGPTSSWVDAEFVNQAAKAVFHYFKHDLGRQSVTVGEFAGALEKVLRGFALTAKAAQQSQAKTRILESDLRCLAGESGPGWELFFFPRLRDELRLKLQQEPRVLRFRGLRGCVKSLVGARRWSPRCRRLEDQIVAYLRQCLQADSTPSKFSLVVD